MNFATGYGIKPSEMFIKFNPKKVDKNLVKGTCNIC